MLEANRLILDTLERRIDGTVDAESRVEGKVVIEAGRGDRALGHPRARRSSARGARIVHAYVGPFTSIMNDVEIRDSEIEHSIVLEGSVHQRPRQPRRGQPDRQERADLPPAGQAVAPTGSCWATIPKSASGGEVSMTTREIGRRAPRSTASRPSRCALMPDERGWLMEILRADEPSCSRSSARSTSRRRIRASSRRGTTTSKQVDNFACVAGMVKLVLIDTRDGLADQRRGQRVLPRRAEPDAGAGAEPRLSRLEVHQRRAVARRQRADRAVSATPTRTSTGSTPHGTLPYDWTRKDG